MDPHQPLRSKEDRWIEAAGHGTRLAATTAVMRVRMVADGAQGEKASDRAWQVDSDRTQTRVGGHLEGWLSWVRVFMKPAMTSVALCRTRGASTVKLHPRPVQARRSKYGMSECSLVAGNEPAKSQGMPMTCSRAVAADGSDIAKRREVIIICAQEG